MNSAQDEIQDFDVVVVGGGVAGCYTAYRLLTGELAADSPLAKLEASNGGALRVGLFEHSGRLGGRLLSAKIPEVSTESPDKLKYAEFGGFRFQAQMHIVADLATHLKLEHQPFPVDEPQTNPVYVRGKRLTWAQVNKGQDLPYALSPLELDIVQGKYADQGNGSLTSYVANQAFFGYLPNSSEAPCGLPNGWSTLQAAYAAAFNAARWDEVTALREQYEAVKQKVEVKGRLLTDWSWWALMTEFLSQEAIAFMEDTGGYNSLQSTGNATTGLMEAFYFPEVESGEPDTPCTRTAWKHITTGYDDIPNQLHRGFEAAGGQTFVSHQLVRFDKSADDGGYELVFEKRAPGSGMAGSTTDPKRVKTKYLVLAMPKRALELLDQDNFFFQNPAVNTTLDTVINVQAIRIFMAYEEPWWVRKGATCGRSTTDLPVRQFYYWMTAEDNGPSIVLASYSNGEAQKYWSDLEAGDAYDKLSGSAPNDPKRIVDPQGPGPRSGTKTMAELAHRQLAQVVGVDDAPPPYYAHFQDWSNDPWGAAWHAWSTGSDSDEVIPKALQPLPDEQVYICGECWSNVQGWVQGALNTSEQLLQTKLGLAWPEWLQEGGTWLGPGS